MEGKTILEYAGGLRSIVVLIFGEVRIDVVILSQSVGLVNLNLDFFMSDANVAFTSHPLAHSACGCGCVSVCVCVCVYMCVCVSVCM